MPLFEYDCPLCDREFESISKPYDPVICPHCGCNECVRRFPLIAGHQWKCSSDGAAPRKDTNEMNRRMSKRERVTGMLDRQMAKIDGKA